MKRSSEETGTNTESEAIIPTSDCRLAACGPDTEAGVASRRERLAVRKIRIKVAHVHDCSEVSLAN